MIQRACAAVVAAFLSGALSGCALQNARQITSDDKLGISNQMLEQRKRYKDDLLGFQLPASWSAKALPSQDPHIHAVGVECPAGLHARITLIRHVPEGGTFAAEVVRNLKETHPELKAESHRVKFSEGEARGFRYAFSNAQGSWEGWVVSAMQASTELGFLGQFPRGTPEPLQQALVEMMHTLGTHSTPPDRR